ncbi:MAG: PHP domain-containing protein [Desulfitobacterium sp.]
MIDLHVHTKTSDNSLTAEEIIKMAKDKGITHLAITDHDTTKGLNEAISWGSEYDITVIPGIEISAYDNQRKKRAHILGLNVEPGHPALDELCAPLTEKRNQVSYEVVQRLIAEGYDLSWEEVHKYAGGTGVYKQHIMHALVDQGYCDGIYSELYKTLFHRGSSTEAPGRVYIPLTYADARLAIHAVREAGGMAALAHPGQLGNFEAIEEWVKDGLEGIEAFHPSHSKEDVALSLEYARRFNLTVTGGSDFHGFYGEKPVELGCPDLNMSSVNDLILRTSR